MAVGRVAIVALVWTVGFQGDSVAAFECEEYSDCAPFVCVSNECVPCWNDDDQCRGTEDWYCDINTGDCTDGEECLPYGYPYGTGECDSCGSLGGNLCPAPDYLCNDNDGFCYPVG
jgi:hypothetical protein